MYKSLIVLLACAVGAMAASEHCPIGACETVRCAMPSCENGRIDMHGGYCNCCPICVQSLAEGEDCKKTIGLLGGSKPTAECGDGLTCDIQTMTCLKSSLNPCHLETARKQKLLSMSSQPLMGLSMPTCTEDGFYAAKQCVEAVCQCVMSDGTPIEPYTSVSIGDAANMDCNCARDKAQQTVSAALFGRPSPQCDTVGNYKMRQCRESVCNCVDPTGQPIPGYQADISQAPNMSCDCARANWNLWHPGSTAHSMVMLACDELGNFVQPSSNN